MIERDALQVHKNSTLNVSIGPLRLFDEGVVYKSLMALAVFDSKAYLGAE